MARLHGGILSIAHLDRQTLRPRPLDQPPGMNGTNVQVAHRPPDSVNRPNVCRRAPSVTADGRGASRNVAELNAMAPRLDLERV